jgi:Uma2 family endonuclease
MAIDPIRNRHWTRKEYDELIQSGFFEEDEPIELVGGQLIVAEPKGSPHSTAIALTAEALRAAFGRGWLVRVQDPVALDDESEPEPDIAVVPGLPRDYLAEHPARPALLVEVAESSLAFDRRHKGSLYARAGVADYWIVNLVDGMLEVYRGPALDRSAEYGWRYLDVQTLRPGATVTPLARPAITVAVADLLT